MHIGRSPNHQGVATQLRLCVAVETGLSERMGIRVTAKRTGLAVAAMMLALLSYGWIERIGIATRIADAQFDAAKVDARYILTQVGPRTQRIENLSVGNRNNPDLTAEWVEIDLAAGLGGVKPRAIRASGVRLRGRLIDGRLSLGAVDQLLPGASGEPFALPDLALSLTDARARIDTPYGVAGVAVAGRGNLTGGFAGVAALAMPQLVAGSCRATAVKASGRISVVARRPGFTGPVTTSLLRCDGLAVDRAKIDLDARATEAFDRWDGKARFNIAAAGVPQAALGRLTGDVSFSGTAARTRATARMSAASVRTPQLTARALAVDGSWEAGVDDRGLTASGGGTILAANAAPRGGFAVYARQLRSLSVLPIGPIADGLAVAVTGLDRGSALRGRYQLDHRNGSGRIILSGLNATSSSGARLLVRGEAPVIIRWPGGMALRGDVALSGGGFPTASGTVSDGGAMLLVAPMIANRARFALAPVRLDFDPLGIGVRTVATLDARWGFGRVSGLRVPIAIAPGQSLPTGCQPVAFESLQIETLALGPTRLRTCLSRNAVLVDAPRLAGTLGQTPVSMIAANARYRIAAGTFALDRAEVRLGEADSVTRLELASLIGRYTAGRLSGRFDGAAGRIGSVPILASQGQGDWTFANGRLALSGALRIADAAPDPRYFPLIIPDLDLRLADGRIDATGTARHPRSGIAVAQISLGHALGPATGEAVLTVRDLTFNDALQPEELTPITLGVIANVRGSVAGRGVIAWNGSSVISSGGFRTQGLDLAAAFGPVTGITGEIALSDLLGLETPPGQSVRIAGINPGILVTEGEIRYRMLPELKVAVEGGSWPFAGGTLSLEPTILDLSESATRRLNFKVKGLDAARFINAMEFENISATGTFDGELPMVFDANGGRIEGGVLTARSGGTVSYIGQVSNEQLGVYGTIAFDALKALKYSRLSINLDGAIDGDVITRIGLAGVSQAPVDGVRASLPFPVRITGIDNFPFIFNITITAKFRQLFEMARSFDDPSILINRALPQLKPLPQPPRTLTPPPLPPVQPLESAPTP